MKSALKKQADNAMPTIPLTPEQLEKFQTAVKIGLYKELHRKGLLTDTQLKRLISMQNA